jgi:hypothetical protein
VGSCDGSGVGALVTGSRDGLVVGVEVVGRVGKLVGDLVVGAVGEVGADVGATVVALCQTWVL